ncbi:MAG: hypothetical protein A2511_11640 [Deltaproteobacteria bacterium RIFOXYD12_FULL_50_9]|nr:MAG: hypothetical protein A2511_11640 [Deltaproteobacteria bacterium RIFOXYD12_FULL_50_9]
MATIDDLLGQYRVLRDYCDGFWRKVEKRHGADLHCRKGCHECCRLQGVTPLEAHVLLAALRLAGTTIDKQTGSQTAFCPLLRFDECLVYPHRPLICRTHGLAISGQLLTGGAVDCCPANFSAELLALMDRDLILNIDMITDNLMRLNLAFCLLLGDRQLAGERIGLSAIIDGLIPASLTKHA